MANQYNVYNSRSNSSTLQAFSCPSIENGIMNIFIHQIVIIQMKHKNTCTYNRKEENLYVTKFAQHKIAVKSQYLTAPC